MFKHRNFYNAISLSVLPFLFASAFVSIAETATKFGTLSIESPILTSDSDRVIPLLQLAKHYFSNDILPSESKMIRRVANGESFHFYEGKRIANRPTNSANWSTDRSIRAETLAWLCTNQDAAKLITSKGIEIEGISVKGDLELGGAKISFPLSIKGCAFPNGAIKLKNSHVESVDFGGTWVKEFSADGLTVAGSLYLDHEFQCEDGVSLHKAIIGDDLMCNGGHFYCDSNNSTALDAESARIGGSVFMEDGFSAEGNLEFESASIGKDLSIDHAHLRAIDLHSYFLDAQKAKIDGNVYLTKVIAHGTARFDGAIVQGSMVCMSIVCSNIPDEVFTASGAHLGDVAFFEKCQMYGGVRFDHAVINEDVTFDGSSFIVDSDHDAISIEFAEIKGNVNLNSGLRVKGTINLAGLNAGHRLSLAGPDSSDEWSLDLRSTKVTTLSDTEKSWPKSNHLLLNNFHYDQIDDNSPIDVESRIKWLRLQPTADYLPQPYVELADFYRRTGHEEEAKQVLIAKNDDYANHLHWYSLSHLWYSLIGRLVGYGYKTGRAFGVSLLFVIVGTFIFGYGRRRDLILPSNDKAYSIADGELNVRKNYPPFNPFIYSLETFVPLVKLGMDDYWRPNAECGRQLRFFKKGFSVTTDGLLRGYLWIHILAGWVLTTLWVGGLTGLIKT